MKPLTVTRFARAPLEKVFRHASDLRNAPNVVPAIRSLEVLTPGPVGLGTRFRETRVMFGREVTEEMEVIAFDPPRSYVVGCENHGCRYRSEFSFRPKDGGTEMVMTFQAVPLTLIAKVFAVLTQPLTKKAAAECAKDLDAIAAAAEKA